MGLSKSDKYFIEKLGEIILGIPEDSNVPDNINEFFFDKMKKLDWKFQNILLGWDLKNI